jgi:hypothetical protein
MDTGQDLYIQGLFAALHSHEETVKQRHKMGFFVLKPHLWRATGHAVKK